MRTNYDFSESFTANGWNTIKTYADGTTLDIKMEAGLPVLICVTDTEDSPAPNEKEIQDEICNTLGLFVHLTNWQGAENGTAVATVVIDEQQGL